VRPPFRADHVGSLLRLPDLKEAREQFKAGKTDAERKIYSPLAACRPRRWPFSRS
jgi:methionine synthase II (cobalamin-independent)